MVVNVETESNNNVTTKNQSLPDVNIPMSKRVSREIVAWFWVALAFMLINGTIGQARVIPSGSMENTLLIGDHLIMSRIGYDAGVPFTNWHVPLVAQSAPAGSHHLSSALRAGFDGLDQARDSACRVTR